MTKPTKPVDVYVRVSRVGTREHLMSPEDQERSARSYAGSLKLKLGKVITDLDQSGGKLDRPGLQEAVQRVEAGTSGGLIVAYLDRFSRDVEQGLGLLRRIEEAGGSVYAPNMPQDTRSAEGEFQVGLWLLIAQRERRMRSEGFERAKERAIENGIPVNSRAAVGYVKSPDRTLVPDPDVAPIIRQVFELRARGEGPAALGRFLSSNGVKTSQSSTVWSKQAVYGLIRNRVYLGELRYGLDGRFVNAEAHEPIVDIATWQAAQHPNGRRLADTRSGANLLAGIFRCHACGYSLQGTKTSRGKRIYRCTRTHSGGICPEPVRTPAEPVEEAVVRAFWTLTDDMEAEGTHADTDADVGALRGALDTAEQRLIQALSPDVQDAAGDGWASMMRERRAARDEAAEALGRALALSTRTLPAPETLRATWERMTTEERRELLSLRLDCVTLRRDGTMTIYPAGTGPAELPRRGFRQGPRLYPFPDTPRGARTLTL